MSNSPDTTALTGATHSTIYVAVEISGYGGPAQVGRTPHCDGVLGTVAERTNPLASDTERTGLVFCLPSDQCEVIAGLARARFLSAHQAA